MLRKTGGRGPTHADILINLAQSAKSPPVAVDVEVGEADSVRGRGTKPRVDIVDVTPENAGCSRNKPAYSLHHGRSRTPLVTVVRDEQSALYRILWPDIGLSPPANLTRCMGAARDWAEQSFLTEHRKMSGARRLKSLNKFWWSASPVEKSGPKHVDLPLTTAEAGKMSLTRKRLRQNSIPMRSDRPAIPFPRYVGDT